MNIDEIMGNGPTLSGHQQLVFCAAVLSTLNEIPDGWAPRSTIYMALGCNLGAFEEIEALLTKAGWVTHNSLTITITEKGRGKARELDARLQK